MTATLSPIHPGEHLAEFMDEFDISQYQLAKDIDVPSPWVNEIVLGQRALSADISLRLGRYFGNSAQFWLNLQVNYDIEAATAALEPTLKNIKPINATSIDPIKNSPVNSGPIQSS